MYRANWTLKGNYLFISVSEIVLMYTTPQIEHCPSCLLNPSHDGYLGYIQIVYSIVNPEISLLHQHSKDMHFDQEEDSFFCSAITLCR